MANFLCPCSLTGAIVRHLPANAVLNVLIFVGILALLYKR